MLATAAYFKITTPVRLQRQQLQGNCFNDVDDDVGKTYCNLDEEWKCVGFISSVGFIETNSRGYQCALRRHWTYAKLAFLVIWMAMC